MAFIDVPMTSQRLRVAERFWRAAMVSLAITPLGMSIAHRSSPVYVVLSAVLCLVATSLEGRIRPFLRRLSAALTSPLGLAVLAFVGWTLMSVGWSEFGSVSLRAFGEFWLPIAAALILALTLPKYLTRQMFWILAGTFLLSGIIIVAELGTGLVLRKAIGVRADPFIFNRPVLTLLMLALPLTAWILDDLRRGAVWGLALLLFLTAVVMQSESDAAVLGLAIICLTFPMAWFVPRVTFVLVAFAVLVAFCVSPLVGPIAAQLIPPAMHEKMASSHSKERVELWQSFGYVVREKPILGSGFGISPRMAETTIAQKVPVEHQRMLNIGHPHNAALQIWVELGAIGAAIAVFIAFLTLRAVWRLPHLTRCASMALIAGAGPVALVGHGAWQGWWAASLGAAIIWMQAASRFQTETKS
ncbi:polymerase [Microvirga sp. KLBC 81]|uniref:O-antigen ligase family protein n=1 Tax=Microvirga sp. KLBC 81 TaxID=1862707 RepID=UPI000D50D541|nr:O-antigen ligase family protein [Microvirga sp. KLBC 81]PVE25606.1 polymerase [Microvirga sp. KLBC 81]